MNNIGQRIKELRKKNDLTQERLADFLGVTDKAVSKWECGLAAPDLALIIPLTKILQVSADELLGGKPIEADERKAEFDARCDDFLKYDVKDNYQIALQAVKEYPRNYKYLSWLAEIEHSISYNNEYKEDPTAPYSVEMLEKSIKHSNIVIEECEDTSIRDIAIWNAMVCFKEMGSYDEALKYAEMYPKTEPFTRDKAMEMCLQGEKLTKHLKWRVYNKLSAFCISLSRIYVFAERKEPHVMAALDIEEATLKSVFTDGNYLEFHKNLCCAYQKRAEFEIVEGNYDKAVDHLRTMMYHAKRVPFGEQTFTCGVLEGISMYFSQNCPLYILMSVDDLDTPIYEQVKNRIMTLEIFSPLWEREDFKALCM